MTLEQYKVELKALEEEHATKKLLLMKEYVDSSHPYKIGDKVTDHIGSVLVEEIGFYVGLNSIPQASFWGLELKKDGTPMKRKTKRFAFRDNII